MPSNTPCYLRLRLPVGGTLASGEEMGRWAMDELTTDQMADSLEKVYDLGGCDDRASIKALREEPDGLGGFTSINVRRGIAGNMQSLAKDLHTMERDGRTYELHFNPAEWFKDGKQFYDFAPGRLYWLAASGALSKLGFEVEGTGL